MRYEFSQLRGQVARIARQLRRDAPSRLLRLQGQLLTIGRAAISRLTTILIGLLWLTFAGYIRAWRFLQPILEDLTGRPLKGGHRALFCLAVSAVGGVCLMLRFTPFRLDLTSFLFWVIHGLVVHAYWEQGEKWCRRRLGLRPTRFDPARPFDGLDLGN